MGVRTSGYFKEERKFGEVVYNSDFELESEGWIFQNFKDVSFDENGVHLKIGTWDGKIYPRKAIEIAPEDLFLVTISAKPEDCDNDEKFYLRCYPLDKFWRYRTPYHTDFEFRFSSANVHTFKRLLSVAEFMSDYYDAEDYLRAIRAIAPFLWFETDDWDTNEVVNVKSFSIQRVNPSWLKVYPVMLYKIYEPTTGMSLGTHFSEEYFTGIFHSGEYNLALTYLEEGSGSNSITLSVVIQSYDQAGNIWYDAVVFDDVTVASGSSVSNKVYTKIATAGLGYKQRVKMVLSGSGSCAGIVLNVSAVYKQ
ncbi:MAG: hypothetical protein J7J91_01075 [Deltaproteobacteria bacterium]|nr:hypothetical protein [Deltaproteobacteria bacterium]